MQQRPALLHAILEEEKIKDQTLMKSHRHRYLYRNHRTHPLVKVRDLLLIIPCTRVIRLSRRFPLDTAVFAGLEAAIGDCVIVMSPNVDPIDRVGDIVTLVMDGNDIVQGLSSLPLHGSWLGKRARGSFYWYNRKFLNVEVPVNATYFTGLSRRAVNSLTNTSRNYRYLRHLVRHIGYQLVEFDYAPLMNRASRHSLRSGYSEAVEMISSYSTHPLRAVTIIGVAGAFFNLLYAIYVVIVNLVKSDIAQGWTTTSLQLSLMFFVVCGILAMQSEYIGRILTESRREPRYFIMEEVESETLISDMQRRNVSD